MKRIRSTSPVDDELKKRRERGRKAQKAFRHRQITAINDLQDKNYAMQTAIASISRVASKLGSSELDNAVHDAWLAAGFDDPGGPSSDDGDDGQGTAVSSPPQLARSILPENPITVRDIRPSTIPLVDQPPSSQSEYYYTPVPFGTVDVLPVEPQTCAVSEQRLSYHTGRMSPRLGYGLWLEPVVFRLSSPPIDIVPFLGANATLSGVVFWTGLLWGLKLLCATLNGNGDAAATAYKVFGDVASTKHDYRAVLDGIDARLTFRKLGYMSSDHPGNDPDAGLRVKGMMTRVYAARGTPLETFLRPDAVEDLLRGRLGEDYRVIELGLQGLCSSGDASKVRKLVDMLIRSSVCLGDGPRWRVEWITRILEAWSDTSAVS